MFIWILVMQWILLHRIYHYPNNVFRLSLLFVVLNLIRDFRALKNSYPIIIYWQKNCQAFKLRAPTLSQHRHYWSDALFDAEILWQTSHETLLRPTESIWLYQRNETYDKPKIQISRSNTSKTSYALQNTYYNKTALSQFAARDRYMMHFDVFGCEQKLWRSFDFKSFSFNDHYCKEQKVWFWRHSDNYFPITSSMCLMLVHVGGMPAWQQGFL